MPTILSLHLDNLRAAKTFEEFKSIQIAYVELLIKNDEARKNLKAAVEEYIDKSLDNSFETAEWKHVEEESKE